MRKPFRSSLAVVIAVGVAFAGVTVSGEADADAAAVETALLAAINTGRAGIGKPALGMHDGMREKQRGHAQYMSEIAALTHDGYAQRAQTATPDPVETNGAPDDGFTGYIAENVAQNFRNNRSDVDIAAAIYEQWLNSPGHKKNMFDESGAGYNAAGVGIFEEASGKIWAALLLTGDNTPPDGSVPPKKKKCRRHRPRCRR